MAKRTLFINRVKLDRTCRRLDMPIYMVVGILECLWQLTARECPAGDIGRLPREDIAVALGWKGDEEELVDMLVRTNWLDAGPDGTLIVHDWPQHCDDTVHAFLCRNLMVFADGSTPSDARLSRAERDAIARKKAESFVRTNEASVRTDDDSERTPCAQKRTNGKSVRTKAGFVAPASASASASASAIASGKQELKAKARGGSAEGGRKKPNEAVIGSGIASTSSPPGPDPSPPPLVMPNAGLEDSEQADRVRQQIAELRRGRAS